MTLNDPFLTVEEEQRKLLSLVEQYNTVSFDIFDTVLMRSVFEPTDLFYLMNVEWNARIGADFREARMRAEQALYRVTNPRLDEIYARLQTDLGLTGTVTARMMEQELLLEERHVHPRQRLVRLANAIRESGKRLYFITDMYLPEPVIAEFLKNRGIAGYDGLFVSNTWRTNKRNSLFDRYIEQTGTRRGLHIGDRWDVDVFHAQKRGLEAFRVLSPRDRWLANGGGAPSTLPERLAVAEQLYRISQQNEECLDRKGT